MKGILSPFLVLLTIWNLNQIAYGEGNELTVSDALRLAEQTDPSLKAANARVAQAEHSVGIARSDYYPRVDLEAIDSTGFPGSSGALGVEGLMGSPYRSGLGYGAVASMTLFRFRANIECGGCGKTFG